MLPDPDAHGREREFFAFRLDHHVGLSATNDAEQCLPVSAVHAFLKPWFAKHATTKNPGPRAGAKHAFSLEP